MTGRTGRRREERADQQRRLRGRPRNIHTPFTLDVFLPPPPLFPLPFPNFSSSNFTCKTFHAVIGKHLTYFTAFHSSSIKSNIYPSSLHATRCPATASPGLPSHRFQQGSSKGAGERGMASIPACSHPLLRWGSSQMPGGGGTGDGDGDTPTSAAGHPGGMPRAGPRAAAGGSGRGTGLAAGAESLITSARPLPGDYQVIFSVMQTMRSRITSKPPSLRTIRFVTEVSGLQREPGLGASGPGQSFLGGPSSPA